MDGTYDVVYPYGQGTYQYQVNHLMMLCLTSLNQMILNI